MMFNSYTVCSHTHQSWVPSSCYGDWRVGFSHTAADAHLLEWDTCLCCKFDTAGGDQGSTGLHRLDCGGGEEGKRVRQGRGGEGEAGEGNVTHSSLVPKHSSAWERG